ncbi:MAG: hypothetical protein Q4E61_02535 [Alphaproteobacteria bacterium]|nr:hypothetical protein [Alphaproteobacteria bacterium]
MTGREGESTVEKGLVVIDSYGNEYVWIPVFEKSATRTWGVDYSAVATPKTAEKTKFTAADYTNIESALKAYTATYKNNDFTDKWYGNSINATSGYYNGSKFIYYTNGNMSQPEYETLYHNMLVSVYKNGGFYIGRYEMGTGVATSVEIAQSLTRTRMSEYKAYSDSNTSTTVRNNAAPSIAGMPTPVSKANAVGYTYITQNQAQMLAKKMGEVYGYGFTTSSLMFGVQWDAVCVFLEKYGKISDGTQFNSSYLKDNTYSKLWGNYLNSSFKMDRGYYNILNESNQFTGWNAKTNKAKGDTEKWLCTTGASDQNSVLNIYDFGGNLREWTLERYSNSEAPATGRGGKFDDSYYAFGRYNGGATYDNVYNCSARPSLFM